MSDTYDQTRARLETYFDRTAAATWARLTSDAPVSGIRQTVREGRDRMRAAMLGALPEDLSGARVLDAGCGAGQMSIELAKRGADVVAIDIAPNLLEVAWKRTPDALRDRIEFSVGDMLDPKHGAFDHIVAMDSLIHYSQADILRALEALAMRCGRSVVFTIAPKTLLLSAMHKVGKLFPRADRSPAIVPVSGQRLIRDAAGKDALSGRDMRTVTRVSTGFYISEAMEVGT